MAFSNNDNKKGATAPLFIFSKSFKKDKILESKPNTKEGIQLFSILKRSLG